MSSLAAMLSPSQASSCSPHRSAPRSTTGKAAMQNAQCHACCWSSGVDHSNIVPVCAPSCGMRCDSFHIVSTPLTSKHGRLTPAGFCAVVAALVEHPPWCSALAAPATSTTPLRAPSGPALRQLGPRTWAQLMPTSAVSPTVRCATPSFCHTPARPGTCTGVVMPSALCFAHAASEQHTTALSADV